MEDDTLSNRFSYCLAGGWSIFAAIYIIAITFMQIPESNIRFADTTLGFILGTVIATIMNYFFGSSKQSKSKDEALADAVKNISATNTN